MFKIIMITIILFILVQSCPVDFFTGKGSLEITLSQHTNRGLFTDIPIECSLYTIILDGPAGVHKEETTEKNNILFENLREGTWVITVNGKNINDTVVGRGFEIINVKDHEVTKVSVTLEGLEGNGKLQADVRWETTSIQSPDIDARLVPITGDDITLNFSVNDDNGTARCDASVHAGVYMLVVKIRNNGKIIALALETIRIVKNTITDGMIDITSHPYYIPELPVDHTLKVDISGISDWEEIGFGETRTFGAHVISPPGKVLYIWYSDGNPVDEGYIFPMQGTFEGPHSVCVRALSADGMHGGEKSVFYHIGSSNIYSIETNIIPSEAGYIRFDTEQPFYSYGEEVSIEAIPDTCYIFSLWSGDLNGSENPDIITMTGNMTITAHFNHKPAYTLTFSNVAGGYVIEPANNPVEVMCEDNYETAIEAQPYTGHFFTGWTSEGSGVHFVDSQSPCTTVTLSGGDATIRANFALKEYELSVIHDGNGKIESTSPVVVKHGVFSEIKALPINENSYTFDKWTVESGKGVIFEDLYSTSTNVALTDGDATLMANFLLRIDVTVSAYHTTGDLARGGHMVVSFEAYGPYLFSASVYETEYGVGDQEVYTADSVGFHQFTRDVGEGSYQYIVKTYCTNPYSGFYTQINEAVSGIVIVKNSSP